MAQKLLKPLSSKLLIYKSLLLKWQKAVNLVAPSTLIDCETRHFQDSLQLLPLLPENAKTLFDFGSGAGFPALVLAIERPELAIHLFESDQKKCAFLSTVSRETLTPVVIHNQRIEAVDESINVIPDVITARALASLTELIEISKRWWTKNPQVTLLFPKGARFAEEITEAEKCFSFDLDLFPSVTDDKAKILRLTNINSLQV